jgi:N-acetylmuramoyl-L-alanine amidase
MTKHTLRKNECISSLADRYSLFWETIWFHPSNAELRSLRQNANILYPGDEVFIPDMEIKEESVATEQKHRFRRKGVPAKLRLQILKDIEEDDEAVDKPKAGNSDAGDDFVASESPELNLEPKPQEPNVDAPYILLVDKARSEGSTDGDGRVEISIPEGAQYAELIIDPNTDDEEVIELSLGDMDPVDTVSGVKKRLANLQFYSGDLDEEQDLELYAALSQFQHTYELEIIGLIDQATKDKLVEVHGS